jgi:hypothetical protein
VRKDTKNKNGSPAGRRLFLAHATGVRRDVPARHLLFILLISGTLWEGMDLKAEIASGLYRITAGTYSKCCGIAGEISYSLPSSNQTFVKLMVDSEANLASMSFLTSDAQTVFSEIPCPPAPTIYFTFDYGFVSTNQIFFHVDPGPYQKFWSYTVTNWDNTLWIQGMVGISQGMCSDVANRFNHSSVIAERLTNGPVVIDQIQANGDSIQFHFTGDPPFDYTVEYTDSIANTNWTTIEVHQAKLDPIDVTVTNAISNISNRFFRIRKSPCNCL